MDSDKSEEEEEQEMEELSVSFFKLGASPTAKSHLHHPPHPQNSEDDMVINPRVQAAGTLKTRRRGASFSCLSVAAIGANATLANTALGNGVLRQEILPGLDSPKSFRPLEKSPSLSNIEYLMSSNSPSSMSEASARSAPERLEMRSFLSAADAQTAGGAAGEDRVQAVCSEEDGWLFCAIYDGFNGRDAADFLAGTLYENISHNLMQLVLHTHNQNLQKGPGEEHQGQQAMDEEREDGSSAHTHHQHHHQQEGQQQQHHHHNQYHHSQQEGQRQQQNQHHHEQQQHPQHERAEEVGIRDGVLRSLRKALMETEAGFMEMVQQEMEERPDLAMVGSCVLVVLLYGGYVYTLSLGDSRAVLATTSSRGGAGEGGLLRWVQLTQDHVVAERSEKERVLAEHPDDPQPIVADRVKGKIKLTRAFGAGYLKKTHLNEKLMGLLRVPNLSSPPYISAKPHLSAHKMCLGDQFVVMGSDGLFDFFTNDEVVSLLHRFMLLHPNADPARYMLDQLLLRAAKSAGMTLERLRNIQFGRRRAYHDDVTIMVVTLGAEHRTSSASTVS